MTGDPTVALFSHRVSQPLHDLTGLGRYLVRLTQQLVAGGRTDVVLVAPHEAGPAAPDWAPAPVVRVGAGRAGLLTSWTVTGRPRLDALVPELDLVHVAAAVVAVPAAVPTVYTVHDLFPLRHPAWSPRRGSALFRGVLRALPQAAAIIAPSRTVADELLRQVEVRADAVHVIHEAPDDRFRAAVPSDLPAGLEPGGYWLALGSTVPRKDHATLVRALAQAGPGGQLPLVVAGPVGPAEEQLTALARELGAADRLRRIGFVPDEELPGLVAGARALLHPSLDEGFGLPPLEAMAAGIPVLAARAGAIPEVVGDAAHLIAPGDVPAWAAAMDALATDEVMHAALSERGRTHVADHTWARVAARTETVYASCLR